jgi:cell division transport system permease protein
MFWLNIKRIFKSGFVNFFRNGFVSLSAILIMTITLSVFCVIIFSSVLLNQSLDEIKKKVDVNVYFLPNASEEQIMSVQKELQSLPEVEYVEYVSRDQALENFQFRHKTDEGILQALDELEENPLGAILNIKTKETSQYESISVFLEQNYSTGMTDSVIDNVNYNQNKETIQKLSEMIEAGKKLGGFVTALFMLISILITFNTIRLSMYISRDEIKVMKLVGASGSYISGPFIVSGIMYGVSAAIVTLVIFYPITYWLGPSTSSFFNGINIFQYYLSSFMQIFVIIFFSGILIGSVSSFFAIKRFLREQRKKG